MNASEAGGAASTLIQSLPLHKHHLLFFFFHYHCSLFPGPRRGRGRTRPRAPTARGEEFETPHVASIQDIFALPRRKPRRACRPSEVLADPRRVREVMAPLALFRLLVASRLLVCVHYVATLAVEVLADWLFVFCCLEL